MKNIKNIVLLSVLMSGFFSSCYRAEKENLTKISVRIPSQSDLQAKESLFNKKNNSGNVSTKKLNPNGTINPSTMTDINCFGILVSGPEDYLQKNQCTMNDGSGLTFPVGFFTGGYYSSTTATTATFDAPSGKDRVFRLVGFKVDSSATAVADLAAVCGQFFNNDIYQSYMSDPYLLAEVGAVELPAGGTKDIDMISNFVATSQIGDCKGPNFGSGVNGPPAKFGVMIQDNVGTAVKPLRSDSCVAVKFQLQDALGRPANTTAAAFIDAKISPSQAGGSFYNMNDGPICTSANLLGASGSADITIAFHDATKSFNDRVLFFKPDATPISMDLTIADIAGVLASTTKTYNFSAAGVISKKWAFLDLFNLKTSAVSNSTANKSMIRRNECRMGVMQILDENDVPTGYQTQTFTNNVFLTDTGTAVNQDISYFSSYTNCTANTSATYDATYFQPATFTPKIYGNAFYYKVNTAISQFSIHMSDAVGSASPSYYVGASGDLSFGVNFWGVVN